ncbi:MAG TPA: hypothetical protein VGM32_24025 [Rhodopila sp.]|jgi:lauroyl/myristoyl acyltransferase
MHGVILRTLVVCGLIAGASAIASAAPATRMLAPETAFQTTHAQPVDYYWNHHRYKHRSWDKRRRRWRYY